MTRIAPHLLLQVIEWPGRHGIEALVLVDEATGEEVLVPASAVPALAAAVEQFAQTIRTLAEIEAAGRTLAAVRRAAAANRINLT